jgi:hypothetical protein
VLSAGGERADVRRLQDWADLGAGDGAASVVGVQDDGLEGLLAEPLWRQPGIPEGRSGRECVAAR